MRSYVTVFVVAAVAVFSTLAGAQPRGPSTPEERARAVQTAKSLQSDPLAPNVQQDREWLVKWLIEVPDISVKMCTTFLGDLGDSKSGNPGAIIATLLASEAAFGRARPFTPETMLWHEFGHAWASINGRSLDRSNPEAFQWENRMREQLYGPLGPNNARRIAH